MNLNWYYIILNEICQLFSYIKNKPSSIYKIVKKVIVTHQQESTVPICLPFLVGGKSHSRLLTSPHLQSVGVVAVNEIFPPPNSLRLWPMEKCTFPHQIPHFSPQKYSLCAERCSWKPISTLSLVDTNRGWVLFRGDFSGDVTPQYRLECHFGGKWASPLFAGAQRPVMSCSLELGG